MNAWTRAALLVTAVAWASPALALGTITDGAVSFSYTAFFDPLLNYLASETDVTGAGVGDQTYTSWWYYRVSGDTQESGFSAPDSENYVGNRARLNWTDVDARGLFEAVLEVGVLDGGAGSGNVFQRLTARNTSGGPLTVDIFHYTDFDVGDTWGDDSAVLTASGTDIQITLSDASSPDTIEFIGYSAGDYQVADFPIIVDDLTDAAITDLDNSGLPFVDSDFAGAFQWSSVTIADGDAMSFMSQFAVNTALLPPASIPVPEPGSGALLGLGLLGLSRRHGRERPH